VRGSEEDPITLDVFPVPQPRTADHGHFTHPNDVLWKNSTASAVVSCVSRDESRAVSEKSVHPGTPEAYQGSGQTSGDRRAAVTARSDGGTNRRRLGEARLFEAAKITAGR
jgi:hypothetical protein